MPGVYLSGIGNTKYCVEKLAGLLGAAAKTVLLEDPALFNEYYIRESTDMIKLNNSQYPQFFKRYYKEGKKYKRQKI